MRSRLVDGRRDGLVLKRKGTKRGGKNQGELECSAHLYKRGFV